MLRKISKVLSFLLLFCLILSLVGCGSSYNGTASVDRWESSKDEMSFNTGFSHSSLSSSSSLSSDSSYNTSYDYGNGYNDLYSEPESANIYDVVEQKLVYTSSVDIQTKEMDSALSTIYSLIEQYGGIIQSKRLNDVDSVYYDDYFSDSYYYNHRTGSSAYIFIRIPQKNYINFMSGISQDGNSLFVTDVTEVIENMTDTYYDIENRLNTLYAERDRLYTFMSEAKSVSEMLDIEARLTDVLYSIESATNRKTTIDNDVDYAKITLNIREVLKYNEPVGVQKTLWERIKIYISDSGSSFADTLEGVLKAFIYLLPHLILIGIAVFVVMKLVKWYRKNHHKKNKKKKVESNIPNWARPVDDNHNDVIGESESEDSN